MTDYRKEIVQLDTQLADAANVQQLVADLRERRAALVHAQELEAEARRRAREARAAADELKVAQDADRAAQAAPVVAELGAIGQDLVAVETEMNGKLWELVRSARAQHDRRMALVSRHQVTLARLRALSSDEAARVAVVRPETLGDFVRSRWARFNGRGWAAAAAHWERVLAAEETVR